MLLNTDNKIKEFDETYYLGKLSGRYINYHIDGKTLRWEGSYHMDIRVGLWKFYSINAELKEEILYII